MEEQTTKKQKRIAWFRWICRAVFLLILMLLVPAYQKNQAVLNLKSLDEVDFLSEPGFLLESLPVTWQSWLYTTFGKDQLLVFETVTRFDCSTKTDLNNTELALISEFKNLKSLYVNSSEITNVGLGHLKELTKLETLILKKAHVTDIGLIHLEGLTNLNQLDLSGTQVSDAGLIHLKRVPKLEWVDLSGTQISDAGLVHLNGLTKSKVLALKNTQITASGVTQLQAALPNCEIQSDKNNTMMDHK